MITRATGCARRSLKTEEHFLSTRRFTPKAASKVSILQTPAVLHDQCVKGSCEGQAHSQGIESITGQRVSAVRLWENAKRLQGDAYDPLVGTLGEYVIEGIARNGWEDYQPGEDDRDLDFDMDGVIDDTLEGALKSRSRKGRAIRHQSLDLRESVDEVRAALIAALQTPRTYLVLEAGSTDAYQNPPANTVLGLRYRSGNSGGHAERILGYTAVWDAIILQGSWGPFTWCAGPGGETLVGCTLVSLDVIRAAWAVDVCQVLP